MSPLECPYDDRCVAIRNFLVLFCVIVGADPEQRQARNNNGSKFTVLSVATQRSWKNTDVLLRPISGFAERGCATRTATRQPLKCRWILVQGLSSEGICVPPAWQAGALPLNGTPTPNEGALLQTTCVFQPLLTIGFESNPDAAAY